VAFPQVRRIHHQPAHGPAARGAAARRSGRCGRRGPRKDESAFPTNETRLCAWCEFQQICPVCKHLFKVRSAPNKFASEPGVKLVDHWTALDAARADLKRQIEEIEAETSSSEPWRDSRSGRISR